MARKGTMTKKIEIHPDEKYVLVFNKPMTDLEVSKFAEKFQKEFREDANKAIAVIADDVTIVPADQVVGYIPFERKRW
jgi:hypothetical protein